MKCAGDQDLMAPILSGVCPFTVVPVPESQFLQAVGSHTVDAKPCFLHGFLQSREEPCLPSHGHHWEPLE